VTGEISGCGVYWKHWLGCPYKKHFIFLAALMMITLGIVCIQKVRCSICMNSSKYASTGMVASNDFVLCMPFIRLMQAGKMAQKNLQSQCLHLLTYSVLKHPASASNNRIHSIYWKRISGRFEKNLKRCWSSSAASSESSTAFVLFCTCRNSLILSVSLLCGSI